MLAVVRREHVFTTIDPPIASEFKVAPSRTLICLLGFFGGFALSLKFSLLMHFVVRQR